MSEVTSAVSSPCYSLLSSLYPDSFYDYREEIEPFNASLDSFLADDAATNPHPVFVSSSSQLLSPTLSATSQPLFYLYTMLGLPPTTPIIAIDFVLQDHTLIHIDREHHPSLPLNSEEHTSLHPKGENHTSLPLNNENHPSLPLNNENHPSLPSEGENPTLLHLKEEKHTLFPLAVSSIQECRITCTFVCLPSPQMPWRTPRTWSSSSSS